MDFRTEVDIPPSDHKLDYRSGILFMGSCFTEHVGNRMKELQFRADVNPFGINYNPSSVAQNLWALMDGKEYTKEDLHHLNDKWFSFDHHSRFSDGDPESCLERINNRIRASKAGLKETHTLVLTWGTAWVYVHRDSACVVSNCHKVPADRFRRYLLTVDQITDTYSSLFARMRREIPDLRVILSVSPVRHWKDGPAMNTVSKAILVLAAYRLTERFSYCQYFPAYEIAMDDLRDYRFYADDMLHPNGRMIEYIWEKLSGAYFDDETRHIMEEIRKLVSARNHRPFQPGSRQYAGFCNKQIQAIKKLKGRFPFLALDEMELYFRDRLKNPGNNSSLNSSKA